eukprot:scaffold2720_cov123-Cylindrotheca_fusiformis.AAC.1
MMSVDDEERTIGLAEICFKRTAGWESFLSNRVHANASRRSPNEEDAGKCPTSMCSMLPALVHHSALISLDLIWREQSVMSEVIHR